MTEEKKPEEIATFENEGTKEGPQTYPREWDWKKEAEQSLLEHGVVASTVPDNVRRAMAELGQTLYLRGLAQSEAGLTELATKMRQRVIHGTATFEGKIAGLQIGGRLLSERMVEIAQKRNRSDPLHRVVEKATAKHGEVLDLRKKELVENGEKGQ